MEVTYHMTYADQWRCNTYIFTRKPSMIVIHLITLTILIWGVFSAIHKHSPHPMTASAVILTILLCVCGYVGYYAFMLFIIILARMPNSAVPRICTTSITSEGVRDITPEQDQLLSWDRVTGIRYDHGDIYFWKRSGGIIVPRGAFHDSREAQHFYRSALGLRQGRTIEVSASSIERNGNLQHGLAAVHLINGNHTLSTTMLIGFDGKLNDGEQVLWQGSPNPTVYGKTMAHGYTMIILGVAAVLTSLFLVGSNWNLWGFTLFIWSWVPGMYAVGIWSFKETAQKINYLITDQRILTSEQKGMRPPVVSSLEYGQIDSMKYERSVSGVGSIEFGAANAKSVALNYVNDLSVVVGIIATKFGNRSDSILNLFSSRQQSDPFLGVLQPGETLLWQGQPERTKYIHEFWGRWGGVVFYPVLGWLTLLAALDFSQMQPLWVRIAEFTPLVLTAIWLIGRRYQERSQRAENLFYAVTSKRLLLLDQTKSLYFAEVALLRIQEIKFEQFKSRMETFAFGGKDAMDFAFEFLTNPNDIRLIITEARRKVRRVPLDWVDVTAARATAPKPTWESRLAGAFLLLIFLFWPFEILYTSYYDIRYYNPGMRHYQRGEYAAAAKDLRIDMNATPNEQAPYYLGLALMHEGQNREARSAFQRASRRALSGKTADHEMDAKAQAMIAQIDASEMTPASATSRR